MPATDAYTLVLSNATHAISADDANLILAAVESGQRTVEVQLDLFGDGTSLRTVRLMTRHVVMLFHNADSGAPDNELFAFAKGKVTRLRRH